jgi:NAD(P)H-nitrite reductase large subunit
MRIVIVGNSATAVGAIETIRLHDQRAEIITISEEPHMIYSRPMLSHYLAGDVDRVRLAYRRSDFYNRHNVQAILNARVTAIDTVAHAVRTEGGETFAYDKLLIATGGLPIVPPLPGLNAEGIFTFTRLDDAQGIIDYVDTAEDNSLPSRGALPVRRAVVVGGGMIGIKAADALLKRRLHVTMVELAPRILSAALDEIASRMLTNLLREHGVEVLTNNTLAKIHSEGDKITAVETRDERLLPCDLLVFGIGVRPNAALAKEAGIAVNRGIVVDAFMRTSVPDVYAAGDVAEAYDLVVDMNRIVAIWPNAYRQGAIAGADIVGMPRPDQGGIAMNTVEVCGVPAMSIGSGNAEQTEGYEILSEVNESLHLYKRLVLRDNRLVGAILVGNISRAGIYTGLIRNKLEVGDVRKALLSDHFGLLSLPDQYRKHIVTGLAIEV